MDKILTNKCIHIKIHVLLYDIIKRRISFYENQQYMMNKNAYKMLW